MAIRPHRFHVVLVHPEIPQNTGNIGRTCVAVGAKLWLVRPLGFRLDERRVRRSGLDYWQHLQYRVVDHWQQMAEQLPRGRTWFFSAHASRPFTDASFREGDFFVFGSETQGLDPGLLAEHADRVLNIPTTENVRSLNLANTVAIVLYEALRQAGDPTDQGAGER